MLRPATAVSTIGAAVTRNDALHGKSVISKAVSVLEAFSPAAPRLSLKQLAVSTGLPQSTAHRLASELVAWGGLERVDGGGYQIGLRLWEIGALAVRGESVREIALPFMQDLFDAAHENVQLAILDGTQAVYIEKITGRGRRGRSPGPAAGCHCTRRASGKSCSHTARTTCSPLCWRTG